MSILNSKNLRHKARNIAVFLALLTVTRITPVDAMDDKNPTNRKREKKAYEKQQEVNVINLKNAMNELTEMSDSALCYTARDWDMSHYINTAISNVEEDLKQELEEQRQQRRVEEPSVKAERPQKVVEWEQLLEKFKVDTESRLNAVQLKTESKLMMRNKTKVMEKEQLKARLTTLIGLLNADQEKLAKTRLGWQNLDDRKFDNIMKFRTQDGHNIPLAIKIIEEYLNGKHNVSKEAMECLLRRTALSGGSKPLNLMVRSISRTPSIKLGQSSTRVGQSSTRDAMRIVSEFLGDSRIMDNDLYKRAVTYMDQMDQMERQGINGESETHESESNENFTYNSENEVVAVNKDQEESKNEFLDGNDKQQSSENEVVAVNKDQEEFKNEFVDGNDKQQRVRSKSQENKPTAPSVSQAERDDWANEVD